MSTPPPSNSSSRTPSYEISPPGHSATARPGDFILCHRPGFVSRAIRLSERVKYGKGSNWSHAAFCETEDTIIEALTRGVSRAPLAKYESIEYAVVHADLHGDDLQQALNYVRAMVGKRYGFLTDFGCLLRFLTPGRGLWFGMNGTEICSGLVAQAMTRGWMIFDENPASLSPAELALAYGVTRH